MKITIQYWAQARQAANAPSETIDVVSHCSIAQLLQHLADRHGDALRRIILSADSRPHPSIVLVLRDQQVPPDSSTPLRDGDTLDIIPPIAGG